MESDKENTQGENEVDTYPVGSAEVLHKGWALKSKCEFKWFTESQKSLLKVLGCRKQWS